MTPLVSFVLPSYNREPVLTEVLARLEPSRQPFATETIVIDNASTDGSVAMVRRQFPWVRLIALDTNEGAKSRNLGAREAQGKYILALDDDSYPVADGVARGVDLFERDTREEVGCIAYNIQRSDGSYETAGIYTAFTGCGAMFRRSLLERTGGYPEDYLFYVEEYDLSCRIWGAGARVVNPRDLVVLHLKTLHNRSFARVMRQIVRNNLLLWSKYLPPDLADRQIGAEIWRYQRIALKEGVTDTFLEGLRLGQEQIEHYRTDRRFQLARPVAERVLTFDAIDQRVAELARAGAKRVLIYGVGKVLYRVLEALDDMGLTLSGVVDDNPFMHGQEYDRVPISGPDRFAADDYDAVLLGSSSIALNADLERRARTLGVTRPIVRMCTYDAIGEAQRACA